MKNPKEKRIMMKWRAWGMAVALAIGVPAAALAQGVIQSITSSQQSGSEVVRIEMSEPLAAVPVGFAIQVPPRIAIDLPGVGSALGRPLVELNQGNLRSVNVAQAGERTRLVVNLKQDYSAVVDIASPFKATLPCVIHFLPDEDREAAEEVKRLVKKKTYSYWPASQSEFGKIHNLLDSKEAKSLEEDVFGQFNLDG